MTAKLIIDPSQPISGIRKAFQEIFPYLSLEFFRHTHAEQQGSKRKDLVPHDHLLSELTEKSGSLELNAEMTVSELERKFAHDFGISVQVFRRSGINWLETTVTDSWTLERQNREGMELSTMDRE